MGKKPDKFKVYVVADAYQWHDLSVYPDVYQKWVKQIEANPNEVVFFFQTVMMTEDEYNKSCTDLNKWNTQAAQGIAPPDKDSPKPKLEVVPDEQPATILQFPSRQIDD